MLNVQNIILIHIDIGGLIIAVLIVECIYYLLQLLKVCQFFILANIFCLQNKQLSKKCKAAKNKTRLSEECKQ